jgi:hypothetical protein
MKNDGYKMKQEERNALEKFAFHEYSGIYTKETAIQELERSRLLQNK